ncbi:MAG: hypothetical protein ACRCXZ_05700 [Patescibacteria group bacterium]
MKRFILTAIVGALLTFGYLKLAENFLFKNNTGNNMPTQIQPKSNINSPISPYLQKINQYQTSDFKFSNLMIFVGIPQSNEQAISEAKRVATLLKAIQQANLQAIVIAEPGELSFAEFAKGTHTPVLTKFFAELKANGIDNSNIGLWVPFPEPNIPAWNNGGTPPETFGLCFNQFVLTMRFYFPGVKGSILLNTKTYQPEDKEYTQGAYSSLIPFVRKIDKDLLYSAGVQGFPWIGPKDKDWGYDKLATKFLPSEMTVELIKYLGIKNVWFNTGSINQKYTNNPNSLVTIPLEERQQTLSSILSEINKVHTTLGTETKVMINIFAEDKSDTPEATNWSYQNDQQIKLAQSFFQYSKGKGYQLSLFDRAK